MDGTEEQVIWSVQSGVYSRCQMSDRTRGRENAATRRILQFTRKGTSQEQQVAMNRDSNRFLAMDIISNDQQTLSQQVAITVKSSREGGQWVFSVGPLHLLPCEAKDNPIFFSHNKTKQKPSQRGILKIKIKIKNPLLGQIGIREF